MSQEPTYVIVPTNRYSSSDSLLTLDQLPNISPITTKLSTTRDTRSTVLVDTRNKLTRRYRLLDAIRVIRGRTFSMKSFHQNSRVITFRIHVPFAGIFRASKHFASTKNFDSSKYKTVEAESRCSRIASPRVVPFPSSIVPSTRLRYDKIEAFDQKWIIREAANVSRIRHASAASR